MYGTTTQGAGTSLTLVQLFCEPKITLVTRDCHLGEASYVFGPTEVTWESSERVRRHSWFGP